MNKLFTLSLLTLFLGYSIVSTTPSVQRLVPIATKTARRLSTSAQKIATDLTPATITPKNKNEDFKNMARLMIKCWEDPITVNHYSQDKKIYNSEGEILVTMLLTTPEVRPENSDKLVDAIKACCGQYSDPICQQALNLVDAEIWGLTEITDNPNKINKFLKDLEAAYEKNNTQQ